ncbi:MAG: hypothetical protein R3F19_04125 [Verrucomicrobiales bacterium]
MGELFQRHTHQQPAPCRQRLDWNVLQAGLGKMLLQRFVWSEIRDERRYRQIVRGDVL